MRDQQSIEQAVVALRDAGSAHSIGDTHDAIWRIHDCLICLLEYIEPGITNSEPEESPRPSLADKLKRAIEILAMVHPTEHDDGWEAINDIRHVEQALRWGRPRVAASAVLNEEP